MRKIILSIILISFLNLGCRFSVFGSEFTLFEPTPTIAPQYTPIIQPKFAVIPAPTMPAHPILLRWKICFTGNVTEGYLRVRECPGVECREIGLLATGDQVISSGEIRKIDDGAWLSINHPLNGWINQRFVCQDE